MTEKQPPLIRLRDVTKSFDTPAGRFTALHALTLDVGAGELAAIVGRSGSGKTTLLHVLTGVDRATSGSVVIGGTDLGTLNETQLAAWRSRTVGIVFQFFQLLPTLTVLENVVLPMELAGRLTPQTRRDRARELLARVGISEQADKLPATLSGGQQQRAAIARALANDPPLLVADEPTGNLDQRTSAEIWSLFAQLADDGTTVLVVTHDRDVARLVRRVVTLSDGRVVPAVEVAHG